MYVKQTDWGYGVFKYGTLIMEFEKESEAFTYLIYLKEGK